MIRTLHLLTLTLVAACGGPPAPAPPPTQPTPPPRTMATPGTAGADPGSPRIDDPRALWQPPPDPRLPARDPVLTPLRNPPRPPPAGAPDVLLITVDTWRADRLALHGAPRPTSSWLQQFAARSLVAERATAPSPWTWPSMASIATGVLPRSHGVRKIDSVLCEEADTVAEIFWRNGFHTGLVAANNYIEREGNGYRQGYEFYFARGMEVADRILEYAGYFLDGLRADQPFFLHLHFYEPHCPYRPPPQDLVKATAVAGPPTAARDADLPPLRDALNDAVLCHVVPPIDLTLPDKEKNAAPRSRNRQDYYDAYDGELVEIDRRLSDLEALLRARGRWDRTAIVLTGDHGEEFAEHGRMGHGNAIWRESTWVPLVVRPPITQAPAATVRNDQPISLIDVAPTLTAMAGLPPAPSWQGRSLRPAWDGTGLEARPVFSQTDFERTARSVESDGLRLVLPGGGGAARLFDTRADLMDLHDLLPGARSRAEPLLEALRTEEQALLASAICRGEPLPDPRWSLDPSPASTP